MALVRWRNRGALAPWRALHTLEDEFDQFFWGLPSGSGRTEYAWLPAVDLTETPDRYTLEADLPGVKREDIDLSVVDNVVTVKGERKNGRETHEDGCHVYERHYGSFQRSFRLPEDVDTEKIEAKFENGVLRVTLPKAEEAKPKRIEVKVK